MPSVLQRVEYAHPELSPVFVAGAICSLAANVLAGRSEPDEWKDPTFDHLVYTAWPTSRPDVPQLVLYSDGDQVVPLERAENALARLRRATSRISTHRFDNS